MADRQKNNFERDFIMKIVATNDAPAAIGPYSQAVKTANLVFLSGQLGVDPHTKKLAGETIESQTNQVFRNITAVLAADGTGLSLRVLCAIFASIYMIIMRVMEAVISYI